MWDNGGVMKCINCDNLIVGGAKFCARCGHPAPGSVDLSKAERMHPAATPMPKRGVVFVALAVLGPALIVMGLMGFRPLLPIGVAVTAVVAVVVAVGSFF